MLVRTGGVYYSITRGFLDADLPSVLICFPLTLEPYAKNADTVKNRTYQIVYALFNDCLCSIISLHQLNYVTGALTSLLSQHVFQGLKVMLRKRFQVKSLQIFFLLNIPQFGNFWFEVLANITDFHIQIIKI